MDTQTKYFKGSFELCTAYIAFVDQGAVGFWQARGYTADENGVIGKSKSGNDLSKHVTTTWCVPRLVEGEWYAANAATEFPFSQEYIDLFDANFGELIPVDEIPMQQEEL